MSQSDFTKALSKLELGEIKYFDSLGSTNDEALAWAANDAPDMSLVIADEQTAGRGRLDRKWITPAGTALAFSLIFRPAADEKENLSRVVGWAALAVVEVLKTFGIDPQIKWPNDVLINGKKVAGILTESVWSGDDVDCVVTGIGINVMKDSVPPADQLTFQATSLEDEIENVPKREQILFQVLAALIDLRPLLPTEELLERWTKKLAFVGQEIQVESVDRPALVGRITGLETNGSLQIVDNQDRSMTVQFGDVRLRPRA